MQIIEAMLPALWVSLQLTFFIAIIGFPLGAVLGFGMYLLPRWAGGVLWVITEIGRGFPALVVVYFVAFGLPKVGFVLPPFLAVVVALTYTTASYTAETFRSSLVAIPAGQTEAARAVGLGTIQTLWFVTGRQALRIALAPLVGFLILVFQGTSVAYSVGVPELMSVAYTDGVVEFTVGRYLLVGAAMYLIVSLLLESLIGRITSTRGRKSRRRGSPVGGQLPVLPGTPKAPPEASLRSHTVS
ncbi:amino acid ABC transporter permease [Rhodococcus sp. ACPA4]|nr:MULTISPECIES: ABC transporter permease subunit [unclassified Rhodococcus (in: high G+C Gram-positive bacteria)]PBC37642.1 amino acid ABC transporter permease [Rhodococcus sp. ACPA4]RZL27341.1 MAG: ABC transporter permease subunit [Rhodococcus sp. (in: high G+C Gram-positive bacteria)]